MKSNLISFIVFVLGSISSGWIYLKIDENAFKTPLLVLVVASIFGLVSSVVCRKILMRK